MDLRKTNGDVDLTDGDLWLVTEAEAIRQDIEMELETWLQECVYDRSAGVPYLQIIFRRGTTAQTVRFIVERKILNVSGVTEILELTSALDTDTRVFTASGRVLTDYGEVDFDTGQIA